MARNPSSKHVSMNLHKLMLVVAAFILLPFLSQAVIVTNRVGTSEFWMDFGGGSPATPLATNFVAVPLTTSAGAIVPGPGPTTTLNPQPLTLVNPTLNKNYTLQFNGTYGLWSGSANPAQPLTSDGWYYQINGNTFTLSGLLPGDTVSLWATLAWDGAGRAGRISFDGGPTNSLATGNIAAGTAPGKTDMVLVASSVIATGSSLSGQFVLPISGEGQFGGFILQVQSIPEPSVMLLLLLGSAVTLRFVRGRK